MQFEWDENKNHRNISKHGISFENAKTIFAGFTVNMLGDRFHYGETREISIGLMDGVVVLMVVHTNRDGVCRIISARQANKKERQRYEEVLRRTLNS